ncbi:hypothetical protein HYH03_012812 [Edaphochlamys debaryana]|uniref:Bax inhibitor 1 n=1 Tax=Edaphochlamys debaryana TaxID=47281 RepID=A0A835XZW2_9CHLO|nr:hypothetical protein HYH03_012812 [Edaphochlamys debaryana]|eukprot:KAG2488644.1 hypothetical protein HYH03_012812 [Edaphochlamys debaryana]
MDAVERLLGRRWENVSPATFLKFGNLERPIQVYLQRVYATLAVALAISAVGCLMDIQYHIAGLITYLGAFGCLIGLSFTASTPATLNKRYALLAGFAFCQGAGLGRLVGLAVQLNPGLLLTAFMGTAAIFVSFTLASLLSARRSFLFLGGWLASAISCMFVLRLGSWLMGGRGLGFGLELYGGLMVFSAYVLFDTQLIVEKASAGYTDHVKAALDLLVDVVAIFVRVLVILMKNQAQKQEREQRRRKERRD